MKKRYFIIAFIIAFVIFICPNGVEAYDYIKNDCLDDNSCILVCNYVNNSFRPGASNENASRFISLYYYLKTAKWELMWEGSSHPTKSGYIITTKGPNTFGYVFSNKSNNVYFPSSLKNDTFTCPKHGYLDYSELLSYNEICFDNDGKTCKKKYNNVGTAFKANAYKSDKKDYDFMNDLTTYFTKQNYGDISCNDIYNKTVTFDDKGYISSKIKEDLKNNYLKGNKTPKFIENSSAVKNAANSAKKSLNNKIQQCTKQIDKDLSNGTITEEEANNRRDILNNIDVDAAGEAFDDALNNVISDGIDTSEWGDHIECEDIISTEEGSFGWLLNTILNYIKVIGPILVVLLSSIDFVKAVLGFDEKAMKEAQNKLIIRLVAAISLFLVPTLVQLIFSFINQTTCAL